MRTFWDAALAPWWTRISALLESEIASRARRLVAVGAQAAFTGLHQTITWDEGILYIHPTKKEPADVDLAGRGLLLVPSAFTWPNVWPRTDPPWDPAVVYPTSGIADLWAPDARPDDALARCWDDAAPRFSSSWTGRPPPSSSPSAWGSAQAV